MNSRITPTGNPLSRRAALLTKACAALTTRQTPPDDDIETFHFLRWGFDITALRQTLANPRTKKPEAVRLPIANVTKFLESDPQLTPEGEQAVPLVGIDVDWRHVEELHEKLRAGEPVLESPVFIAPLGSLGEFVIDGWHRIALARRTGATDISALVFSRRQIQRALLPGSAALPPIAPTNGESP